MKILVVLLLIFIAGGIRPLPAYAAPSISGISVTSTTTSSATINNTTDVDASCVVEYGTTTEYDFTSDDTNSGTSHSIALTSLSTGTTYHYNIVCQSDGEEASSGDQTFTTSSSSSSSSPTSTPTGTPRPSSTPTPTPDVIPPSITIKTKLDKAFTVAPKIDGTASDPAGVSSVDYSIDSGASWLPVSTLSRPGGSPVTFSFVPTGLEDGNYGIKVRATDGKGNTGAGSVLTVIIDRLPPLVGTQVINIGPQLLFPTTKGSLTVITGQKYLFTLSAVGGPTEISLITARSTESSASGITKKMERGQGGSFWRALLEFPESGTYTMYTTARDGANNVTSRRLQDITAIPAGRITDGTTAIPTARVSLYVHTSDTNRYVLWDGAAYTQQNPQTVDAQGRYAWSLPPGSYYVQIEAPGYIRTKTPIFTLAHTAPITTSFSLSRQRRLSLGPIHIPLPPYWQTSPPVTFTAPVETINLQAKKLVGTELPSFQLKTTDGELTALQLRGSPVLITMLNTWSPAASSQLAVLEALHRSGIRTLVLFPQETDGSIALYKKRGEYTLPMVADPDGKLVEPLNLQMLPTHFMVDQRGIIRSIRIGTLDKEEIEEIMIQ